jgi:hypothetical protein
MTGGGGGLERRCCAGVGVWTKGAAQERTGVPKVDSCCYRPMDADDLFLCRVVRNRWEFAQRRSTCADGKPSGYNN